MIIEHRNHGYEKWPQRSCFNLDALFHMFCGKLLWFLSVLICRFWGCTIKFDEVGEL